MRKDRKGKRSNREDEKEIGESEIIERRQKTTRDEKGDIS